MKKFIWFLVILIIFTAIRSLAGKISRGQSSNRKKTEKTQSLEKSSFVTASGNSLYHNGELFRSIGVNRYNLLSHDEELHCANSFTEGEIDNLFSELAEIGVTSIRFWLFQSFTESGEDLERFNYIINKARENNIFVVPVFENHWADCTEGDIKKDWWYESGYLQPYGGFSLSLKEYIRKIVSLYKDEPTILAWQIMNEAESSDEDTLYDFAEDLSEDIKSIDKNHLISIGASRNYRTDKFYRVLHSIETIDLLEYHDYNNPDQEMPTELRKSFADADFLKKPLIVGEAGTYRDESDGYQKLVEAKVKAFFNRGGSVYMLWSYGDEKVTNDGHNFDSESSLTRIIKSLSRNLK